MLLMTSPKLYVSTAVYVDRKQELKLVAFFFVFSNINFNLTYFFEEPVRKPIFNDSQLTNRES